MGKSNKRGRPKGDFGESSKKTKRRGVAELSKADESAGYALRSSNIQINQMCTKANINIC